MKLFTYKFRELEHLPVTERDAVLAPCFRDPALLRFRYGSVLVMAPLVPACGLGFLYLALFRWQWGLLSAIGCGLLVLFGFIFLYLSGRVAVELWLVRRCLRRALQAHGPEHAVKRTASAEEPDQG